MSSFFSETSKQKCTNYDLSTLLAVNEQFHEIEIVHTLIPSSYKFGTKIVKCLARESVFPHMNVPLLTHDELKSFDKRYEILCKNREKIPFH